MLTKRTVTSLAALLETHLFRSNLAADWGRKFSADEYISQILGACERCHGGQGHIVPGPWVTVKKALVAVVDQTCYVWQSLIKG